MRARARTQQKGEGQRDPDEKRWGIIVEGFLEEASEPQGRRKQGQHSRRLSR